MQLVVLYDQPVQYMLENFWSLHLMNFATWESIYSLFYSMVINKQMAVRPVLTAQEIEAHDKYVFRGFKPVSYLRELVDFPNERGVGDEWTHRVRFSGAPAHVGSELFNTRFYVGEGGIEKIPMLDSSDSECSSPGQKCGCW